MPKILYVCPSQAQSAWGAATSSPGGLSVSLFESSDRILARTAANTMFGKTDRKMEVTNEDVRSMVIETLLNNDQDVWLYCPNPDLRDELIAKAEAEDITVRQTVPAVPSEVQDPYAYFDKRPGKGPEWVISYCHAETGSTPLMDYGDIICMNAKNHLDGTCTVFYETEEGEYLGLHGTLQFHLDDPALERLREVRSLIRAVSAGVQWRSGKDVIISTLMFEIPDDVDRMLASAKLPTLGKKDSL